MNSISHKAMSLPGALFDSLLALALVSIRIVRAFRYSTPFLKNTTRINGERIFLLT